MALLHTAHSQFVFPRRVRILSMRMAKILPKNGKILDVGCGDGSIDAEILRLRPDLSILGIDTLVRQNTKIHVTHFNGTYLPFDDDSFDAVVFIDVLHHTDDPMIHLSEAKRVSRNLVVLKDHTKEGFLAAPTLRLMDWVGNKHFGVALPFNYWSSDQWSAAFFHIGLKVQDWDKHLSLYPWPASLFFDRSLHFIASLIPR